MINEIPSDVLSQIFICGDRVLCFGDCCFSSFMASGHKSQANELTTSVIHLLAGGASGKTGTNTHERVSQFVTRSCGQVRSGSVGPRQDSVSDLVKSVSPQLASEHSRPYLQSESERKPG